MIAISFQEQSEIEVIVAPYNTESAETGTQRPVEYNIHPISLYTSHELDMEVQVAEIVMK